MKRRYDYKRFRKTFGLLAIYRFGLLDWCGMLDRDLGYLRSHLSLFAGMVE